MKAIIVDDQADCIDLLCEELREHSLDVEIIGTSQTILDAFKQINEKKPDLVFLDIEMGTQTSFELLDLFDPVFFKVIFVTAYNEFAIKAFKYSAVDYILKPFSSIDVLSAIELAKKSISNQLNFSLLKEQILTHKIIPKLAINTNKKVELVAIPDILYFEADTIYTYLYTKDSRYMISKNIKEFELLLNHQGFYRPHKSFLININHIKSFIINKDGGSMTISNQSIIPISHRKKQYFSDMMSKLL